MQVDFYRIIVVHLRLPFAFSLRYAGSVIPDDPRTNEELFLASLQEDYEDEAAWDAIGVLRRRGTQEVLQLAVRNCQSTVPLERARGLDVLAQLGARNPQSERAHFNDSVTIAIEYLRDQDPLVVHSAAWALSHLQSDAAISALIEMRNNSESDVRKAVTCGMHGSRREDAIITLIELMDDADRPAQCGTLGRGR
jgi:HEAT repeat protein